nr:lantibiotic dehydratase [uncultured Pedobacter sp.]
MNSNKEQEIYDSDFYILRTPSFSFDMLLSFFRDVNNDSIENSLIKIFSNKFLLEAIFLASPVFYYQMCKYLKKEIIDIKKKEACQKTMVLYLIRICTRSTPFGLFASNSVGYFSSQTNLQLVPLAHINRHVTFDSRFLALFVSKLRKNLDIRNISLYYSNNSLYKLHSKLKFHESVNEQGVKYKLSTVDADALLNLVLSKSKFGMRLKDLVKLVSEQGFDPGDSIGYIHELVDNQLLIGEFELIASGPEHYKQLYHLIKREYQGLDKDIHGFIEIVENLGSIQKDTSVFEYFGHNDNMNNLIGKNDIIYQIDSTRSLLKNELDKNVLKKVRSAIYIVSRLNRCNFQVKLENFKNAFIEKYDSQTVPLALALDPEINLDYNAKIDIQEVGRLSSAFALKFRKFKDALIKNLDEIEVFNEEVDELPGQFGEFPDSLKAYIKIHKIDNNEQIQFINATGPSGINLFGRFSHGDQKIYDEMVSQIEKEETLEKNKIFAEIVHLADPKSGAIITRPHLRKYEIPYITNSSVEEEFQIRIDDLYLKVEQNKFKLISKRLNKEILPRLSNAHNYHFNCLPLYSFLCDLQYQNLLHACSWDWEDLKDEEFLPRVVHENVILSPRTWNLNKKSINGRNQEKGQLSALNELIVKLRIPRHINLSYGENSLFLDLENPICWRIFVEEFERKQTVKITETFTDNADSIVSDGKNRYFNELIIPFIKRSKVAEAPILQKISKNNVTRSFQPGSQWIYLKIYINSKFSNDFLIKYLSFFIKKNLKEKKISKWFFIRYTDPKEHIRLRLYLTDLKFYIDILTSFNKAIKSLHENSYIANIQIDTYHRELERYGYKTMELSESFFMVNSETVLKILKKCNDPKELVIAGIVGTIKILEDFGFDLKDIQIFCKESLERYKTEFSYNQNRAMREQMQASFRNIQADILEMFSLGNKYHHITEIFNYQSKELNRLVTEISLLKNNKAELEELLFSYIHMFFNRLMNDKQRLFEFYSYYYIDRFLTSKIEKRKITSDN